MKLTTLAAIALFGPIIAPDEKSSQSVATGSRIYGSGGQYGVKILPDRPNGPGLDATAVLFSLNDDGSENCIWERLLSFVPRDIRVSTKGSVLGIGASAIFGNEHAIVIWNSEGERLADYALEDLLSTAEIRKHMLDGLMWQPKVTFVNGALGGGIDLLVIDVRPFLPIDNWQKRIIFDLRSGKIWRGPDPFAPIRIALRHIAVAATHLLAM